MSQGYVLSRYDVVGPVGGGTGAGDVDGDDFEAVVGARDEGELP
jgi:hypothetical protein